MAAIATKFSKILHDHNHQIHHDQTPRDRNLRRDHIHNQWGRRQIARGNGDRVGSFHEPVVTKNACSLPEKSPQFYPIFPKNTHAESIIQPGLVSIDLCNGPVTSVRSISSSHESVPDLVVGDSSGAHGDKSGQNDLIN